MSEKLSYLASVSETRAVLEAHGLATKKSLGQHFLINDGVVAKICALADLTKEDEVVEVGPGIGTLTVALLKCAKQVVSIERDADLLSVLAQTCADYHDSFSLISDDALAVSPQDLPFAPTKLVANLPYAVAATIVLDYFVRFESLQSQTVMVQAEVADRMSACVGTKNYGAYTVKLALFADVAGRFSVSENNFFPPPRVKSAVIRLDRKSEVLEEPLRNAAMLMANAAFAARRKTISNSMRNFFAAHPDSLSRELSKSEISDLVDAVLFESGIEAKLRAETLEPACFVRMGQAYLRLFS